MIDLFGKTELLFLTTFDNLEGSVTITIQDSMGVTTIGQIKMDQARMRPFIESLSAMTKVYYDDLSTVPQGYRLNFDVNQNKATVAFG